MTAKGWNHKRRCDYCNHPTHTDELKRVKRPRKELLMCLRCIEDKRLPEAAFYKESTRREYEKKGR